MTDPTTDFGEQLDPVGALELVDGGLQDRKLICDRLASGWLRWMSLEVDLADGGEPADSAMSITADLHAVAGKNGTDSRSSSTSGAPGEWLRIPDSSGKKRLMSGRHQLRTRPPPPRRGSRPAGSGAGEALHADPRLAEERAKRPETKRGWMLRMSVSIQATMSPSRTWRLFHSALAHERAGLGRIRECRRTERPARRRSPGSGRCCRVDHDQLVEEDVVHQRGLHALDDEADRLPR
jgi:hypothetical protein